jgi:hypothetical protein
VLLSRYDDPNFDPFYDPEMPGEVEEIFAVERDSFVDLAKADLKELFQREPESVFYQRQLQVMFGEVLSLDHCPCAF